MRIRTQLLAVLGVAVLVAGVTLAGLQQAMQRSTVALDEQADAQQVARDVGQLLALTFDAANYGGERAAEQWRRRHRELLATLDTALARQPPGAALIELRRDAADLLPLFDTLAASAHDADASLAQRRKQLFVERLLVATQRLIEARDRWTRQLAAEQARERRVIAAIVVGAPAALLLLVIALALLVAKRVLKPLARLHAAAEAVRAGDLGARAGGSGRDELAAAAQAFDAMTESLRRQGVAVQSANRLLEREVALRRDSERRLHAIADNLPAQIGYYDTQQRYTYANATLARAVGLDGAQIVGRSIAEVRGEAFVSAVAPHIERALAGEVQAFEHASLAHGEPRHFHVTYLPDRDEAGAVRGCYVTAFDITERKREHDALVASEARLKLVMDNLPALIGYIDREHRYRLVNRGYAEWHGRPEPELLGRRVHDFYDAAQRDRYLPQIERALAGEQVAYDLELQRRDQWRSLHVTYIPHRDAGGAVQGIYTLGIDLTEQRRAEAQLRTMMESSPLGMFLADAEGSCLHVNHAWQRIAGMTLQQSLGAGWRDAIHPDDRDALYRLWSARAGNDGSYVSEHRYRRRDGSIVWVRGHATSLRLGEHRFGVVGTVEDITERRALDAALASKTDELARSNQELEQFAYVASHDLQEPLRMVSSYGQLLLRRHRARFDGEAKEFLDFMLDGARRAQALIADLLSLARVNSRAQPAETVALDGALDDALGALRVALDESGAIITRDALPEVQADRRQIGQLLQNLLGNALKFRGADTPAVHVGAARDADAGGWRVSVRDNGIGIDAQHHQRIFVLFQRLHLRSDHAGTGIGLAICKKVVERHGGRIGVDSAPGRGSTFWFTLPDRMAAA